MNEGYITLHRKFFESWIFRNIKYTNWFLYLLQKANFKDNEKFLFEGQFMTVKRGTFITSYRSLAKELPECSEQKVRTFLKLLEKSETISIKSIQKATQITICNYDAYQGEQHNSNTVATQQQHSSNTVATSIEERKERKQRKQRKEKGPDLKKSELTLSERKFDFKNTIDIALLERPKFIEKKEELNKFYKYWTEHGEKDRKMRFEKEKSFSITRRLDVWFENVLKFKGNVKSIERKLIHRTIEAQNEIQINPDRLKF